MPGLSPEKLALFSHENYKFSTFEEGRLTSLYFEDQHGNQGRWRRQHPQGECLVYQGQSVRLFISKEERSKYYPGLEATFPSREHAFGERALGDYKVLKEQKKSINGLSLKPEAGYHVFEFLLFGNEMKFCHGSSGTILIPDPSASTADYKKIASHYNGQTSDWTIPIQEQ